MRLGGNCAGLGEHPVDCGHTCIGSGVTGWATGAITGGRVATTGGVGSGAATVTTSGGATTSGGQSPHAVKSAAMMIVISVFIVFSCCCLALLHGMALLSNSFYGLRIRVYPRFFN
jgi:hypothetical protein